VQLENSLIQLLIPKQVIEKIALQDMVVHQAPIPSLIPLLFEQLHTTAQLEALHQQPINAQLELTQQILVLLQALNALSVQQVHIVRLDQCLQLDCVLLVTGAQRDQPLQLKMHVQREHTQLELD
jgi:hypothetical protein